MENGSLLPKLQNMLKQYPDGLSVQELQVKLYSNFKLKLSYKDIESVFVRNLDLFHEEEGRWALK
jgi:hypothetical protein